MYIATNWQNILATNGLTDFDSFWSIDADWVEEPNYRRGGWSGVSQLTLTLPQGEQASFYLKRHENHCYHPRLLPWLKKPTLLREKNNLLLFARNGIPSLELIYYASKKIAGKTRAVMMTLALESHEDLLSLAKQQADFTLAERHHLIRCLAKAVRTMHQHHIQHTALYPQHVFVSRKTKAVRFIDLEGARRRWRKKKCMLRDLDTLQRYTPGVSLRDKIIFLKSYLGHKKISKNDRKIWRDLEIRYWKKQCKNDRRR